MRDLNAQKRQSIGYPAAKPNPPSNCRKAACWQLCSLPLYHIDDEHKTKFSQIYTVNVEKFPQKPTTKYWCQHLFNSEFCLLSPQSKTLKYACVCQRKWKWKLVKRARKCVENRSKIDELRKSNLCVLQYTLRKEPEDKWVGLQKGSFAFLVNTNLRTFISL